MGSTKGAGSSLLAVLDEKEPGNVENAAAPAAHPSYYDKAGMRTYGDDEDHDHEPPVGCCCEILEISPVTWLA